MKKFLYKNVKETATLVLILIVFFVSLAVRPELLRSASMANIINSILMWMPLNLTMCMGMMMTVIIKDIDLSIGAEVALSGMVAGIFWRDVWLVKMKDTNEVVIILIGFAISLVVGVLLGALNGFIIAYMQIPSIIVTLGTINAYRGLTYILAHGKMITNYELPPHLADLSAKGIHIGPLLVPWLILIALVIVVIFFFVLRYSHFGREVYAVGSNRTAAHLRGINCKKTELMVFTITGFLAGIVGMMSASRFGYVNPQQTGNGLEFVVISCTIIGGVSVSGGSGNVIGVFLGCTLLGTVNTMISTIGIPGTVQKFVYGIVIVLALLIDKAVTTMQRNRAMDAKSARKEATA
ncbi:MAG: ABC transporter permease [Lachnospiraceae bacterium]|jgi:rhamnose transport system permease protein|nr:ABC transporter permease [Lachnospiraceae bacterium]